MGRGSGVDELVGCVPKASSLQPAREQPHFENICSFVATSTLSGGSGTCCVIMGAPVCVCVHASVCAYAWAQWVGGDGEKESQVGSTLSMEPNIELDVGLNPMTPRS